MTDLCSCTGAESPIVNEIQAMLSGGLRSSRKALFLDGMSPDPVQNKLPLEDLAKVLTQSVAKKHSSLTGNLGKSEELDLPSVITFPYSRHSSYAELRDLVKVFKPKDVYPCTTDEAKWHEGVSIRQLFGDLCSDTIFRHDSQMRELCGALNEPYQDDTQTSWTTCGAESSKKTGSSIGSYDQKKDENGLFENQAMLVQKSRKIVEHSLSAPNNPFPNTEATSTNFLRDSHDRLRLSDLNEDCVSKFSATKSGGARSSSADAFTNLPRSDSQLRRRKVSFETHDDGCQKRMCLRSDKVGFDVSSEGAQASSKDSTPKEEVEDVPGGSYYDVEHQVYRCTGCSWKIWTRSGQCTNCNTGEPSYHEVFDSDLGTRIPSQRNYFPRIAPFMDCDDDEIQSYVPSELTEFFLDSASTYDSPSNSDRNEYEVNNFIDDESIDTKCQEGTPSAGDLKSSVIHTHSLENMSSVSVQEPNYKQLYEGLSRAHRQLAKEHDELIDDYLILRRDVFGSQNDDEDSAEIHFASVDVEVQDPQISEVIFSQIQGDSQSSAISPERLRTRIDAFLAMANDEEEGWHSISLISTGDNHTEPEIEL